MATVVKTTSNKRPPSVWALMVLLAIQALGATGGGIGLVQDPINNIGMSLDLLEGSPFDDYLIPGLILLIVVGLLPFVVLYGLIRRRTWAWWLAVVAGAGLIIWIITEVALLGYLPDVGGAMQIGMGVLGLLILVVALLRPTRRFFGVGSSLSP
jgi:hypothetical protein